MNRARPASALLRVGVLLLILLGAFALRVSQLERVEVAGDEAFSAELARYPFAQLVQHLIEYKEPHPLGSFVAEDIALTLFGPHEYGARYLSVMAGVLAVALMVPLMRVLLQPSNAKLIGSCVLAALLMAINPLAIWHSRWGRMYAISLALTLISTVLALLISQRRNPHKVTLAGYIAITWLAMNMHYYAAYIIVVQNLFILGRGLFQQAYRPALLRWTGTQVITALVCAPWLWVARNTLTGYVGNGTSPTFDQMLIKSLSVFFVGETLPDWATVAAWVAGALAVVGALRLLTQPRTRGAAILLLLYMALPPLLTWFGSLSRPIFMERYLIAGVPGFIGLAAIAIAPSHAPRLSRQWLSSLVSTIAALAIGAGTLPSLRTYYQQVAEAKPYWRTLAQTFGQFNGNLPPAQFRVAINYPDPGLSFYYPNEAQRTALPALPNDLANTEQRLQDFIETDDVRRIVFEPHPTAYDNQGIAQSALTHYFNRVYATTTSLGQTVEVYSRLPTAELIPIGITFSNHIQLDGARVIPDLKGRFIEVHLKWSADLSAEAKLPASEHIFVHLVRIDGSPNQVAQIDPPFTPALRSGDVASFGLALPSQLEPGNYMVRIGLYDAALPGTPRVYTQDGRDAIELPTGHLE